MVTAGVGDLASYLAHSRYTPSLPFRPVPRRPTPLTQLKCLALNEVLQSTPSPNRTCICPRTAQRSRSHHRR